MVEYPSISFPTTVLLTFAALCLYPILTAIYNVYFHPLAKFPGPILWVSSRLPYIISLLRGNLVIDQTEIHKKYGNIVRLAPNEISFTDEQAWTDIYVHRPGHRDPTKDPVWYKAPDEMPQNIVTALDQATHARFRKVLAGSFTESSLRKQSPLIESFADLLIQRLTNLANESSDFKDGAVVNIVDWGSWFTIDVIGELALGESFSCLANILGPKH